LGTVRGCIGWFGRLLAGLFAVALVLTLPLGILAFDLGRVIFSPERMAAILGASLEEAGGFRRVAMDAIASGGEAEAEAQGLNLGVALSYLTPLEREYLADRLLPNEWVQSQVRASVEDVYAWIDDDRARPDIQIDLRPIKDALRSGGATLFVEVVVDSWPPCTVEQLAEMTGTVLGLVEGFPLCQPGEPFRTAVVAMSGEALLLSLYALPDSLSISDGSAAADPEMLRFKEDVRLARALSRWGWVLSPILLGLIMALAIRSWRGLAWWWGLPLLLGGLLTVAGSFASRATVVRLAAAVGRQPGMPQVFGELLDAAAATWMGMATRTALTHAAITVAIGLAVSVLGLVLGRIRRPVPARARVRVSPPTGRDDTVRFPKDDDGERPSGMFG
jgi:hypothetical protein